MCACPAHCFHARPRFDSTNTVALAFWLLSARLPFRKLTHFQCLIGHSHSELLALGFNFLLPISNQADVFDGNLSLIRLSYGGPGVNNGASSAIINSSLKPLVGFLLNWNLLDLFLIVLIWIQILLSNTFD